MDIIHLPFELWTLIVDLLDIKLQVRLIQLCKTIKDKIFITDLCNIDYNLKRKLTRDIIKKYPNIKKLYAGGNCGIDDDSLVGLNLVELNACGNKKIKKINHMTNLRILDASGYFWTHNDIFVEFNCGIMDDDLVGLNLVKLNVSLNPKIKKINHMTNLRILDASGDFRIEEDDSLVRLNCGIDDDSLVSTLGGLNLVKLNASWNPKIKKINHMTNLRILDASDTCGIGDEGLIGLNLVELKAFHNPKIKKINHMTNLRILDASDNCGIGDEELIGLNLIKLNINGNPKIKKINHMTNLRILDAYGDCGINDDSLVGLNLVELNALGNQKIKKVNHMINLKILNAGWSSGIGDDDLIGLNLEELHACENPKIKKINHMTNLRILYGSGKCGIGNEDLIGLNLVELYADFNSKIKKINHMTNLRKLHAVGNCGVDDDSLVGLNLIELNALNNPKIQKNISLLN